MLLQLLMVDGEGGLRSAYFEENSVDVDIIAAR
jgi:hypothetical protein